MENNISEHRLKCSILQPDGSPMVHISAQNASQQDFSPLLTSEVPTGSPVISEDSEPVKSEPQVVPAAAIEPPQPQQPVTPTTSPTKPKVIDPKDAKLQTLQARNQDLQRQVEELQKLVAKSTGSAAAINQPPPEWVALLNSQTGFPPVLVILIALFSFLVGLLF